MIPAEMKSAVWYPYDADVSGKPIYMRYLLLSKDAGATRCDAHTFYTESLAAMRLLEGGLDLIQVRVVGESWEIAGWESLLEVCLEVGLFRREGEMIVSPFIEEIVSEMNSQREKKREAGRKSGAARTRVQQVFNTRSTDVEQTIDYRHKTIDKRDNIPPLPPTGGDESLEPGVNEFRDSGEPDSGTPPAVAELRDSRPEVEGEPPGLFPDMPPPAVKPARKTRQVLNAVESAEFEQVLSRWNDQGKEVTHVRAPSDLQRRRFRDLRVNYTLEEVLAAIEKIKINPFHTDTKAADLHWFLLPEKFEAVAAYRPRASAATKNTGKDDRFHLPDRDSY